MPPEATARVNGALGVGRGGGEGAQSVVVPVVACVGDGLGQHRGGDLAVVEGVGERALAVEDPRRGRPRNVSAEEPTRRSRRARGAASTSTRSGMAYRASVSAPSSPSLRMVTNEKVTSGWSSIGFVQPGLELVYRSCRTTAPRSGPRGRRRARWSPRRTRSPRRRARSEALAQRRASGVDRCVVLNVERLGGRLGGGLRAGRSGGEDREGERSSRMEMESGARG